MAKTLIAFFSRADENYFGGAMRYVKVGNAEIVCGILRELIDAGEVSPALVIGVPVGFVNVVESKEEIFGLCAEYDIPCIAAFGRKGGSNVAASICNALLYSAVDMVDPMKRGWQK